MARSSSAKNGKNSKNTYRASGSKSSKSSSSGTRHNSSASGSKKRMSRLEQRRAQQQNLIRSVVLAGLGILAIALVLVQGQSFWNVLRSWLFGTQSPNGAANIDRLGDAAPCGIALEARPVYPAAPETGQLSLF